MYKKSGERKALVVIIFRSCRRSSSSGKTSIAIRIQSALHRVRSSRAGWRHFARAIGIQSALCLIVVSTLHLCVAVFRGFVLLGIVIVIHLRVRLVGNVAMDAILAIHFQALLAAAIAIGVVRVGASVVVVLFRDIAAAIVATICVAIGISLDFSYTRNATLQIQPACDRGLRRI